MSEYGVSGSGSGGAEPTSPRSVSSKNVQSSGASGNSLPRNNHEAPPRLRNSALPKDSASSKSRPNVFIRFIRSFFGYRKTSLTFLVILTFIFTYVFSALDNNLDYSISLPSDALENEVLQQSWLSLQKIAKYKHTYASHGNDYVHDYLEYQIQNLTQEKSYIEYDNDLNYTNNIAFRTRYLTYDAVSYYESNNLIVRINGSDESLPAYLVSAHYDSVPSSYGVTDDGFGVATLLGLLRYYSLTQVKQPKRTIVLNFNNNEEFGLYGATAFLYHPWFRHIKYFLNLEGTGAGGKAILFRGTDSGVIKYFKGVRYPHATSLYQQGFNNHLIHSETDYKVYKEKGEIRGLDLAFYKPRDIYHTGGDNIKNVNIKSLWHMLSNSIDYTNIITSQQIDLDDEYLNPSYTSDSQSGHEFGVYASFHNWFFSGSVSQVIIFNIIVLVAVPLISFPLLFLIFYYRRNWDISFINVIKFPASLGISISVLNILTEHILVNINEYLPNSSYLLLVITLFSLFLILNSIVLNGLNWVFKGYKGINHDEKLIVIIQTSLLYWIALIWSTIKLSQNKIGDDHTGEFPILLLFIFQSLAGLFGLVGWTFRRSGSPTNNKDYQDETSRPLLSDRSSGYGANDNSGDEDDYEFNETGYLSSSSSLLSRKSDSKTGVAKYFSYDWSIQFLIIVPLSSLVLYNTGILLLDGLVKSLQESLAAEQLIYRGIQTFAILWALPFLPFIFKLNRIVIFAAIWIVIQGIILISVTSPFDQANPLKLRFLQTIDLNTQPHGNYISVSGRDNSLIRDILQDIPSFKESNATLQVDSIGDGNALYTFNSSLAPQLVNDVDSLESYLKINVLKNSSSNTDYPFGLLTGEIEINALKNRNCKLNFNLSDSVAELYGERSYFKDTPVKNVIIYLNKASDNESSSELIRDEVELKGIPEGFSRDKDGNYIYKDIVGIDQLDLNKLDWDKPYHIGFQWVPNLIDLKDVNSAGKIKLNKLGVNIECFWGEDGFVPTKEGDVKEKVPAFSEVIHYSPNYVSWANRDRGLVSITKYIEV